MNSLWSPVAVLKISHSHRYLKTASFFIPILFKLTMSMDTITEADFERAKVLLYHVSSPLRFIGIWPIGHSVSSTIRFYIFMMWFITVIIMEYSDLIMVVDDLQGLVENLCETGVQTMVMIRLFMFRFHRLIHKIATCIQEDVIGNNHLDPEEINIYNMYNSKAAYFYKISVWFCASTSVAWYLDPWQKYLTARMSNETAALKTPWRVHTFFDISSFERTAFVCLYQAPLCFTGVCYISSCGVLFLAVMNVCGRMAILSHKIKNSTVNNEINSRGLIRQLVEEHLEVVEMGETIDDAFHLVLLFELAIVTLLIGLISYITMLNFDEANTMAFISNAIFAITMILIVYGNCIMGQYLQDESEELLRAFYHCKWYGMPQSHKKAFTLCMTRAQIPIILSAGRFYVYSLQNFTSIMKSSGAYISMLRTLI